MPYKINTLSTFSLLNQFYNAWMLDKTWLYMVGRIQLCRRRSHCHLSLVKQQKTKNALTKKPKWKPTLVQFLNLECFACLRILTKLYIALNRFKTVPALSSMKWSPINPITSLLQLTYTKSRTILIGSNLVSTTFTATFHFRCKNLFTAESNWHIQMTT